MLNNPISTKEIEFFVKNKKETKKLPQRKLGPENYSDELQQIFKEEKNTTRFYIKLPENRRGRNTFQIIVRQTLQEKEKKIID